MPFALIHPQPFAPSMDVPVGAAWPNVTTKERRWKEDEERKRPHPQ